MQEDTKSSSDVFYSTLSENVSPLHRTSDTKLSLSSVDDWLYVVLFVHVLIKLSMGELLPGCAVLMNHLKIYGPFLETLP